MPTNLIAPDVMHTELDDVFYTEYDYDDQPTIQAVATALDPVLFKQKSTDGDEVSAEEFSGVGPYEEHVVEEDRTISTVRVGNKKTFIVVNYKKTLAFAKEDVDDAKFGLIKQAVSHMGMRARTSRDEAALAVYVGGFTTTTTPDGAYLYSNSHTNLNGDTVDNLETGSLTATNLETLVLSLWEQKAQDGEPGVHTPVILLVPPIRYPDAMEITASELKPYTTDNEINYFSKIYPGLQVKSSVYLSATYASALNSNASTSYYLVSRNHHISRWEREPLYTDLVDWRTDDKDRYKYKSGFREVDGAGSGEGTVASNGIT